MSKALLRADVEYIIHCEPDGTILGPLSKTHAHLDQVRPRLTHYSTWAMVYNPVLKKYGLQRKTPKKHDKHTTPKWDMGVAGHNCYEKTKEGYTPLLFEETLKKETNEEIGLTLTVYTSLKEFLTAAKQLTSPIGYIFETFLFKNSIDNEWVGAGIILTTDTLVEFKDKEVLDFRWLTPSEFKTYLATEDTYYAALPLMFEKAETFRKRYFS